jgi:hypothetical protein
MPLKMLRFFQACDYNAVLEQIERETLARLPVSVRAYFQIFRL